MVEKLPSTHTYLLLGDAYINIQEVSGGWNSYVSDDFPLFGVWKEHRASVLYDETEQRRGCFFCKI